MNLLKLKNLYEFDIETALQYFENSIFVALFYIFM